MRMIHRIFGWLDEERVAVMLPDTNADGGRVLAEHVRYASMLPVPAPSCRVNVYPSILTTPASHGSEPQLEFPSAVSMHVVCTGHQSAILRP